MPRKPHNFGEIISNEIWKFFSVTLYCGSVVAYHGSRFVSTSTKKFITLNRNSHDDQLYNSRKKYENLKVF